MKNYIIGILSTLIISVVFCYLLFFKVSTDYGVKFLSLVENFGFNHTRCFPIEGKFAPKDWAESIIKKPYHDEDRISAFRGIESDERFVDSGIKSLRNIYLFAALLPNEVGDAEVYCWAKAGDPIAILNLSMRLYLGGDTSRMYFDDSVLDLKISSNSSFENESVRMIEKVIKPATNEVASFIIFGKGGENSLCNKALLQGRIVCRFSFPEAFFMKALVSCSSKRNAVLAKHYFKIAAKLGDMQAMLFLHNWDNWKLDKQCTNGDKLLWLN